MAEVGSLLASLLGANSSVFTLALVALFVLVTIWMNTRKVNMDVVTSVSKIQSDNMEALLKQNKQLADDLHTVRNQQAELHEMLDAMRRQNAQMQQHIISLEAYIKHFTIRCETCPNGNGMLQPMPKIPFTFDGES